MRIGFVGVGNMGGAILDGFMKADGFTAEDVIVSGSNPNRLKEVSLKHGVTIAKSNAECVQQSDLVFLGVKPDIHVVIAHEFKDIIQNQVLISMAAKVNMETLEKIYGSVPIVRIMPNLNVSIQKGITAIIRNSHVRDDIYQSIIDLLSSLGEVVEIDEPLMSAFIGVAGSSPAFVFRFIKELVKPAIKDGMDLDLALRCATVAVSGSAEYLNETDLSAETLISNVSSPNGTTIEGLKVLDEYGFDDIIQKAVIAVMDKDKQGT